MPGRVARTRQRPRKDYFDHCSIRLSKRYLRFDNSIRRKDAKTAIEEPQSRAQRFIDPAEVTAFALAMLEQITIPFKLALLDDGLDELEEDLEDNVEVLNLSSCQDIFFRSSLFDS